MRFLLLIISSSSSSSNDSIPNAPSRRARDAAEQVTQPHLEALLVALDDEGVAVLGVVGDAAGVDQEVAQGVDAPAVEGEERVDDVAGGLGHLAGVDEPVGVAEHAARQRQVQRHQQRRPVHAVEAHDVLADDVDVGGPAAPRALRAGDRGVPVGVPRLGDVVDQRVDPHVDGLARVAGHGDAPVEAAHGPRHRQVLEVVLDPVDDLGHAGGGGDPLGVLGVEAQQPVPQRRQPEVVVALLDPLDGGAGLDGRGEQAPRGRVQAALDEGLGHEGLVADAVPALARGLVEVPPLAQAGPEVLDGRAVVRVRGPDEVVVGDVAAAGQVAEGLRVGVAQRLGRDVLALRRPLHLHPVLVGARAQDGLAAPEHLPPLEHVR